MLSTGRASGSKNLQIPISSPSFSHRSAEIDPLGNPTYTSTTARVERLKKAVLAMFNQPNNQPKSAMRSMSKCGHKDQGARVYIFGEKSAVSNWMVRHVLLVVCGILVLLSVLDVFVEGEAFLPRVLMVAAIVLVQVIPIRILFRNLCSRVEIDTETEKIRFFRFYNKKIVEAPLRSVEFGYTWIFTCFYAGERFVIPGGYINSIAEVLPEGVEIKFSEGLLGRLAKRQFENKRRARDLHCDE